MIKNFLKNFFLILKVRNRLYPSVQIEQRKLFHYYQDLKKNDALIPLKDTGFKVFSQFEEDGKLLYIFSILGMKYKTFVEIGSDDGVNSNSANLYFNFNWRGLFIDGNSKSIKRGQSFFSKYPNPYYYKPEFICAKVTRENINQIIGNSEIKGNIGLLSIDIDGHDYWIWDAITIVTPEVVIIESHIEFGMKNIVVPYEVDPHNKNTKPDYHGASPLAMTKLAKRKGYRLVGSNELGYNLIFIKNGLAEKEIPEIAIEEVLNHPYAKKSFKKYDALKNEKFIEA